MSPSPQLEVFTFLPSPAPESSTSLPYTMKQSTTMSIFNIMDWKSVKVFKVAAFKASTDSLRSIGRRGSNISDIFGVCGPETIMPAPIGLDTIDEQGLLPSDDDLDALFKLNLMDRTRVKIPFADIVRSSGHRRNIVIFIRHFFCPVSTLQHDGQRIQMLTLAIELLWIC
jgi:hypothetical protein